MEYFNEEFENVVFIYVSDDMEWGRKKLGKSTNLFFVGCGNGDEMVYHSILSFKNYDRFSTLG